MTFFTFLEEQINTAVAEYTYQIHLIRDLVINPLRGNVDLVIGGNWQGQGANRFINEMHDEILPMLESLFSINQNFVNGIKKSEEHMDIAIRLACAQSASLMDDYMRIF